MGGDGEFTALMVGMVSQVYTHSQTHTLNTYRFSHVSHTLIKWLKKNTIFQIDWNKLDSFIQPRLGINSTRSFSHDLPNDVYVPGAMRPGRLTAVLEMSKGQGKKTKMPLVLLPGVH